MILPYFRSKHLARFQAEPAVFAAPGRVNLIGEHTDYAEGFVMPAAIDFATLAGISPRSDGKIAIYSENYGEERIFEAAALPAKAGKHWSDYPLGVVCDSRRGGSSNSRLQPEPVGRRSAGIGAVELGRRRSGNGAGGAFADRGQLSGRRCWRGSASARRTSLWAPIAASWTSSSPPTAAENHALLLDCRDLSFRLAPIPANVALVIANTMVKHSVAGGDYTTRRAEVEAACAVIAQPPSGSAVSARRDAWTTLNRWGSEMTPNSLKRARHVITENLRTVAAADALDKGDLAELGRLMAEAHQSYSKDFEGSCVEADAMVALAQDLPGLIGARLTGGGFGGCTINLVEQSEAQNFVEALAGRYAAELGIVPQIHICQASAGAHRVE